MRPETPDRGWRTPTTQYYSPHQCTPPPHRSPDYPLKSCYVGLKRLSLPKENTTYSSQPYRGPAQNIFCLGDPPLARLEPPRGFGQALHTRGPLVQPDASHRHTHASKVPYPTHPIDEPNSHLDPTSGSRLGRRHDRLTRCFFSSQLPIARPIYQYMEGDYLRDKTPLDALW
jgi:hypothetical protein